MGTLFSIMFSSRRKYSFLLFFLATTILTATIAEADIYTFTDSEGTIHFTNSTPSKKDKKKYKLYMKTPERRMARPGVVPVPANSTDFARYSKYDASISLAAKQHSIPEAFIKAIIRVESDYDPRVVSVAGAQGLMQLMPGTAKRMGCKNSFDPHQNIMGGAKYLRYLANLFGGDMVLTIAGYHAGEGAVQKYSGVPPYTSTHGYIKRVLGYYYQYKKKNISEK